MSWIKATSEIVFTIIGIYILSGVVFKIINYRK